MAWKRIFPDRSSLSRSKRRFCFPDMTSWAKAFSQNPTSTVPQSQDSGSDDVDLGEWSSLTPVNSVTSSSVQLTNCHWFSFRRLLGGLLVADGESKDGDSITLKSTHSDGGNVDVSQSLWTDSPPKDHEKAGYGRLRKWKTNLSRKLSHRNAQESGPRERSSIDDGLSAPSASPPSLAPLELGIPLNWPFAESAQRKAEDEFLPHETSTVPSSLHLHAGHGSHASTYSAEHQERRAEQPDIYTLHQEYLIDRPRFCRGASENGRTLRRAGNGLSDLQPESARQESDVASVVSQQSSNLPQASTVESPHATGFKEEPGHQDHDNDSEDGPRPLHSLGGLASRNMSTEFISQMPEREITPQNAESSSSEQAPSVDGSVYGDNLSLLSDSDTSSDSDVEDSSPPKQSWRSRTRTKVARVRLPVTTGTGGKGLGGRPTARLVMVERSHPPVSPPPPIRPPPPPPLATVAVNTFHFPRKLSIVIEEP